MKKKIRLIDVAEHAGVSKSTVSQYLNGRFDYMSKHTRESIEKSIKILNYVPNPIARSLKTDKTQTIGLIALDVTGFYTSRVIRGIDDYCKRHGYNVLIYNTDIDPEMEAKALTALSQLRVEGLIVAPTGGNMDQIQQILEKGTPVVQYQLEHDYTEKNVVISNYQDAAYEATEYLIKLGHERIGFLTQEFKGIRSRTERFIGYSNALREHGLEVDESLIQYWHRGKGFESSVKDMLAIVNPPTAFFTQHLTTTTDLLDELSDENISIPEDISVLGFDDLPMADFFKVPITTVKQSPYDIGQKAAELLLNNLKDKKDVPLQRELVPCELIIRKSCRAI